ncbi:MAG: hypothetical protein JRH20_29940 [Deltaproteobacteria bacterium]|nr:hypothetical protein [Deltaproteobacteria bacterium]
MATEDSLNDGQKDVIIREGEVEIVPIKLLVKYDAERFEIVFQGNTQFVVDGDLNIGATGELSMFTHGHNICLDSLDGQIHLNSRRSKLLQDLPESVAYREAMANEGRQRLAQAAERAANDDHQCEGVAELKEELASLRAEIEELKCQVRRD